jgi:hypothetical protein
LNFHSIASWNGNEFGKNKFHPGMEMNLEKTNSILEWK